jgi:hypothetical protein
MSTLVDSLGTIKKPSPWVAIGGVGLLILAAVALPRFAAIAPSGVRTFHEPAAQGFVQGPSAAKPLTLSRERDALKAAGPAPERITEAASGRKIVRTTSMTMVVQRPAEISERITALAESLGGYLVTSDSGGQNATSATLTIRVPAARFEQARAEIRKQGSAGGRREG